MTNKPMKGVNKQNPTAAGADDESAALELIIAESLAAENSARRTLSRLYVGIKPIFAPTLIGKQHFPEKPVLMVGNHALFALDVPLVQATVLRECGRFVRAMADKILFANELTRNALIKQGGILGHPVVCTAMMEAGKDLMVFPGGSYEVNKPAAQRYRLKWKERYGFARLAAENGYTILPFATIGPDEFYGRYMEGEQWMNSRLGKLLIKYGLLDADIRPDMIPPIPRGLFGGLLPKPQRFYMSIGQPVDLSGYKGEAPAQTQLTEIRNEVAKSIEGQISDLLLYRAQNSDSDGWLRKLLIR